MAEKKLYPVILAGGSGTRLWPLSRSLYPKQFHALQGDKSLLQETALRVSGERFQPPLIIGSEPQRFLVAEQLRQVGVTPYALLLEQEGRGTAAAIAAAAALLAKEGEDAVLLVLSSDAVMEGGALLEETLEAALEAAITGHVVTLGIEPRRPETGYGYIQRGKALPKGRSYAIAAFHEKPDRETAQAHIDRGDSYWNAGIFMARVGQLRKDFTALAPEIFAAATKGVAEGKEDLDFLRLGESFLGAPNEAFDRAIMEKITHGAVVPFSGLWSDVGSWDALWELEAESPDDTVTRGDVLVLDSKGSFVRSDGPLTVVQGLDEAIVVASDDVVYVGRKGNPDGMREVIEALKSEGRAERLLHRTVYRPWGSYSNLVEAERYLVKKLLVYPGRSLSLQYHNHRAEHWVVVGGVAKVEIDGKEQLLNPNESVYIPVRSTHRLTNPGKKDLELIEVQTGELLIEEDIVRLDDVYGRIKDASDK